MSRPLQSDVPRPVPLVIAHRGASAVAPENTAASFREALRLGAKAIECDVRVTRDGELVLFHDESLERVARRPGRLEDCDRAALAALEVGGWFGDGSFAGEPVLGFADSLRICREGGALALVERKTGGAVAYAAALRETGMAGAAIVQSFDWDFLRDFRDAMPGVPVGALGDGRFDEAARARLAALAPDWIGWRARDLGEADLPAVRALGAKLALWTVNDPAAAARWAALGADAIITDAPDAIAAALG